MLCFTSPSTLRTRTVRQITASGPVFLHNFVLEHSHAYSLLLSMMAFVLQKGCRVE